MLGVEVLVLLYGTGSGTLDERAGIFQITIDRFDGSGNTVLLQ